MVFAAGKDERYIFPIIKRDDVILVIDALSIGDHHRLLLIRLEPANLKKSFWYNDG